MRTHTITGGGGVRLYVTDQGPADAPVLMLIHGWAQDHACWQKQSTLAETHRLITLDLRGHGQSDAPQIPEMYNDTALWAADINAVITGLGLDQPILVGWSFGSRVIASYLDRFGSSALAGVVLVGGVITTGKAREDWMVGPSSPGLNRDLYTDDETLRSQATANFVRACTFEPLDSALTTGIIAANMRVTALVRRAMFAADWDFRPVYAGFDKPLLAIHGVEDTVVAALCGITVSELAPRGDLRLYENTGHSPFLEQANRFNQDLTNFATLTFGAAQ